MVAIIANYLKTASYQNIVTFLTVPYTEPHVALFVTKAFIRVFTATII